MPSKYGYGHIRFYNSRKWKEVSATYMASKNYLCERCGNPAQICHHKTWLNDENITDITTALGSENLECLCLECHNNEHGYRHNLVLFDEYGNVSGICENAATRQYNEDRADLDTLLQRVHEMRKAL